MTFHTCCTPVAGFLLILVSLIYLNNLMIGDCIVNFTRSATRESWILTGNRYQGEADQ